MQGKTLTQWLTGTWTLERFALESEAGESIEPMGADARGYVAYGADGWMSFLVEAANRQPYDIPDLNGGTPDQTIAAARSFLAYAGTYRVDDAAGCVVQRVEHCLLPNWVGEDHKRYIAATGDDGLTLTSDPFPLGGAMHRIALRFRRRPVAD